VAILLCSWQDLPVRSIADVPQIKDSTETSDGAAREDFRLQDPAKFVRRIARFA